MPRTTLNIHNDIFEKINNASVVLNMSKREIIVKLLMMIMRNIEKYQMEFSTVKYQPDDAEKRWHCFSIVFHHDEFEFWVNLRKIYKFSVSYLVGIAVDAYLDEILKNNMHNYATFKKYMIYKEIVEGIVCFQSYWGIPEERLKTLPKNTNSIRMC